MKSILLVNQGHTDNIGDQLISEITGKYLSSFFSTHIAPFVPDQEKTTIKLEPSNYLRTNKEDEDKKVGVKEIVKKNYSISLFVLTLKYYKVICKKYKGSYDAIIIGGGELLSDYIVFIAAMQAWLLYSLNNKIKVILYGVSGTPFAVRGHRVLRNLMKKCDLIFVRDADTQIHLNQYVRSDIQYAPDIVFSMNRINGYLPDLCYEKKGVLVTIYSPEEIGKTQNMAEYFDQWIQLISEKIDDCDGKIRIGYTTQSDYRAACVFYDYIVKNGVFSNIDVKICDYTDWKGYCLIAAESKYVITARMHAMIIALQCNSKVVPYLIKRKIEIFNQEYILKKYNMYEVNKEIENSLEIVVKCIEEGR